MTAPAEELRPGKAGYWVGGVLVGLGVLVGTVLFAVALSHSIGEFRELGDDIDAMDRFAVPGEAVVTLDEAGEYVVYVEGPVTPVGRVGASAVTIESTEGDSTPLVLRSVGIDETYDIGDHAGRAALRFTVDEPGDYRVTVGPVPASVTAVAIGPRIDVFGPVGSVFVVVFVPAGVGGILGLGGAVLLIVTGVRRSGARRRARLAATPTVSWPAGPSSGAGMPPGYGGPPGFGPTGYGGPPGPSLPPGLPPSAYPPPTVPPVYSVGSGSGVATPGAPWSAPAWPPVPVAGASPVAPAPSGAWAPPGAPPSTAPNAPSAETAPTTFPAPHDFGEPDAPSTYATAPPTDGHDPPEPDG